jgi:hypothetical protein
MCDICKKFICPPACPSYDGRSAEHGKRIADCAICKEPIYLGDLCFARTKLVLCSRGYAREQRARALAARPFKKLRTKLDAICPDQSQKGE